MRIQSILFSILLFADASYALGKEIPIGEISAKIFEKQIDQRTCKVISRGSKEDVTAFNPDLQNLLNQILENVREQKKLEMMALFHPRLSVTKQQLDRSFKKLSTTLGKVSNVSIYRLWAINTVDGTPSLVPCVDDQLSLGPHYGYPLQFGLWLQVMGEEELGRIYTTIIAYQNKWKLGAWHVQQWTHKGKDAQAWVEEALKDAANDRKLAAYVKMELAVKLLEGGGYVFPQLKIDINATKATYFTQQGFIEFFRSLGISPDAEVVAAESIFAKDGAGLGIRFVVKEKLRGQGLIELCKHAGVAIYSKVRDPSLGGLRCGYLLHGEAIERDGKLGSRFIPRSDIKLVQPVK